MLEVEVEVVEIQGLLLEQLLHVELVEQVVQLQQEQQEQQILVAVVVEQVFVVVIKQVEMVVQDLL
tara:strand:+ start:403 stop:600 length:198 start_codon:yes stop_codon:yes gene_type:complete